MTKPGPLQWTYEDARRQLLRDGIAMSTAAKIAWFEEMAALAVKFEAINRLCPADEDNW